MKKTHTQFALVFVAVLVLHLAIATVLRNSADTGEPHGAPAPILASNHTSGQPEIRRGPNRSLRSSSHSPEGGGAVPIPDAFANPPGTGDTTSDPGAAPPIVKSDPPADRPEVPRAPESATRRLTVTELLATDSRPAGEGSSTKPTAVEATGNSKPKEPVLPKIRPIPTVPAEPTGPRKIRSLPGG